jgi:hypothetical protein
MTVSTERPVSEGQAGRTIEHGAAKRVPDFFIVGHAKSGTTALHRMLGMHPQVHMPAKEPRFFAIKDIDIEGGRLSDRPGRRPRTLDGYLDLFAGARADQLIGEATPVYLRSAVAAGRIASVCPEARIIAILREPVSFLRSFHLQSVRGYNESQRDFRKAIELVEARREGRHIPRRCQTPADLLYTDHVRYVEQLRRYHEVFAPEQVLVLIYDDFRADNEGTVREVLRFLELDDTPPIREVNTRPSRDVRLAPLHSLVRWRRIALRNVAAAGALSRAVGSLTPARLRGSVRGRWRRVAFAEPQAPDERFTLELRARFKGEVEALSDYLGRDLVTLWGYGDVG